MGSRVLLEVNREAARVLKQLGRATSPEMIDGAKVLKRAIRRVLGVPGHGKPAPPGEPPRKQSGAMHKSVRSGVVGARQRVAVLDPAAPMQQFGVDTASDGALPRSRRDLFTGAARDVQRASRRAHARRQERRNQVARRATGRGSGNVVGRASKVRHTTIEPRPFMERALTEADPKMVGTVVANITRQLPA